MAQGLQTGKQRSVDASRFAMVPRQDVPRSSFDVTHAHKTTFDSGWLIPVYVDEVLPGDSHRLNMTAFARLATPIVPVMDNLILESFFFFVPNRLLWDNWERFMGEQDSPSDTTAFLIPQVSIAAAAQVPNTVADYFGITNQDGVNAINVNALPFRALNRIWNEWFRDQDLQDPAPLDTGDGPDVLLAQEYVIRRRGKRHDYFTTCRPWPQKPTPNFDTGVLGLYQPGGRYSFASAGAPVSGIGVALGQTPLAGATRATTGNRETAFALEYVSGATDFVMKAQSAGQYPDVRVLVNDLRTANMIQLLMEQNARGGTRYAELVRAQFGVTSPDARLQRSEYLGGGRTNVTVNPVAQTSASGATGSTTVLGELAGVGTAVATNHGFSQSFTEHGYIIGLVSVRADLSYQQGVNRMWFRRSRYDFYTPMLANLGEQAVLSREIYSDGTGNDTSQAETATGDFSVFGYNERWSEYKYKPSRVSGRFRSTAALPLDIWHFSQNFTARPLLNDTFIQETPPVDRVLQVGGNDFEEFLFDSVFDVRMVRCMPVYSLPGLGPRL